MDNIRKFILYPLWENTVNQLNDAFLFIFYTSSICTFYFVSPLFLLLSWIIYPNTFAIIFPFQRNYAAARSES